jgi:hypothetical protein
MVHFYIFSDNKNIAINDRTAMINFIIILEGRVVLIRLSEKIKRTKRKVQNRATNRFKQNKKSRNVKHIFLFYFLERNVKHI